MEIILWLLLALIVVVIMISYIFASLGIMFIFGAPWVPTPPEKAMEMLEFVGLKPGESILDLGCGDASILITAAKEFGVSKALGYELNPFLVLYARWRVRRAGLTNKVSIRLGNFFKAKPEDVDVIALYLMTGTIDKLIARLGKYFSSNTRVVSRGFKFSNVEPRKDKQFETQHVYVYTVGDLCQKK